MKPSPSKQIFTAAATSALALIPFVMGGCASPPVSSSSQVQEESGPSGARLWAQNCTRCHNSRSPSDYSGAQWDVAMLHMRVRANLTAREQRRILEFLQSGN